MDSQWNGLYGSSDLDSASQSSSQTDASLYRPKWIPSVSRSAGDLRHPLPFSTEFEQFKLSRVVYRTRLRTVMKGSWLRQPVLATMFQFPANNEKAGEAMTARDFAEFHSIQIDDLFMDLSLWAQLRHPNLLLYMCSSTTDDKPFCVAHEYKSYVSIAYLIDDSIQLTPAQFLDVSFSVACGMLYLHAFQQGQIHGYLSPSNCLVNEQLNQALISELILHHQLRPSSGDFEEIEKVRYFAPEVLSGEEFSQKADVYSFGLLLWNLWTAEVPFEEFEIDELKNHICMGGRPRIIPEDKMPDELSSLIQRCLHGEPLNRPSFEEIIDCLREDNLREQILQRPVNHSYGLRREISAPNMESKAPRYRAEISARSLPVATSSRRRLTRDARFMNAVHEGNREAVRRYLENGADVEAKNYDKRSALHIAATEGDVEMVMLLLDRGANPNVRDRRGSTPMNDAQHSGHYEVALLLQLHRQKQQDSLEQSSTEEFIGEMDAE